MAATPIPKRSQTLLTAAVIICDWIASNTRYFPLNTSRQDETVFDADTRAAWAWRAIGIPAPWRAPHTPEGASDATSPDNMRTTYDRLFAKRFGFRTQHCAPRNVPPWKRPTPWRNPV